MSLTDDVRDNVLDALNGVDTLDPVVAPIKLRLLTANGDGATPGVELAAGAGTGTGAGYAAGGAVVAFDPAADGLARPTADLRWDNMPAATIVGAELWDATPRRIQWAPLAAPRTVESGEAFEIPLANVTETLTNEPGA